MALGVRNNDKEEVSSDPKARGIKSTNDRRWRKLKPTFCHFFPTLKKLIKGKPQRLLTSLKTRGPCPKLGCAVNFVSSLN